MPARILSFSLNWLTVGRFGFIGGVLGSGSILAFPGTARGLPLKLQTMTVKVTVYGLSGDSWVVDGQQGWCMGDVMNALEEITDVPRRNQRLLSGTQELKDASSLSGGGDELPSEGEILAKLLQSLSQCPGQSLPLAEILSRLPAPLRSKTDAEGVVTWLQRYGIFEVSGPKGEERVMLTVGMLPQAEKPSAEEKRPPEKEKLSLNTTSTVPTLPAPAPPGPVLNGPGPIVGEDPNGLKIEKTENRLTSKEANAIVGDDDNLNPSSVQLRGLPFRATIADVMNFLGDHARFLSPVRDNIRLLSNRDGRPSGFARVFFVSPQAAHKCRDALHKKQMENRYIEVLACADRRGRRKADDLLKEPTLAAAVMDACSDQEEKERVLEECRLHMSGPDRQQILLSMLGIALSDQSRAYLRRANLGLKHFLARFPNEFLIDGPKGCEKVHWLNTDFPEEGAEVASIPMLGSETLSWGLGPNPNLPNLSNPEPQTPDRRMTSPTGKAPSAHSHFCMATPSDWGTPAQHRGNNPLDLENFPNVGWPPYAGAPGHDPMMPMLDFSQFPPGGGWPDYSWPSFSPWNPNMSWGEGAQKGAKKSKAPDGASLRSHAHLHPQAHPFAGRNAAVEELSEGKENRDDKSGIAALRLRGLPFSVTVQDVLAFFAQHDVADLIHDEPGSALLLPKANGRPSGQAVVQMRSRKDAETAQKALNHKWVGNRYIEVFVYGEESEDTLGDETEDLSAQPEASLFLSLLVRNPEFAEWRERLQLSEFPQDLFRNAPEHIRDDREIAMTVLKRHGYSLKFASPDLQDCQEVVLCAVEQAGSALAHASGSLKANKAVVLAAVGQYGSSLEHACEELQNDREVVMAAVSNQARALRHASKDLQADPGIVLAAAARDAAVLAFAAAEVRNDKYVMGQVTEHQPHGLRYAGEDLRSDWGLWLKALERDPSVLAFAPQELRASREFMCLAAQRNGFALDYAAKPLQKDVKLLMMAVEQVEQQCRTESALNAQDLCWQLPLTA
ncbi:Esrp2 [Symbiodinium sp. CCMP2592]|nr:Esrp2 [Symbiodinium sp. CCMP2592]